MRELRWRYNNMDARVQIKAKYGRSHGLIRVRTKLCPDTPGRNFVKPPGDSEMRPLGLASAVLSRCRCEVSTSADDKQR
ncbi:hypothetical protein JAAARDRAFT_534555 [Jaapia argillacea MUCL 33604]|uniref:Uncharacterized protein n=1 Tax=Jaapia argillacea MUCL 33604 TaxID=933084 RepID=A0A067P923_9AGAM|nr:hypothetical protein JAAARDRAFT_534555 [Jaapia argillacea MUCL 33604]